MTLAGRFDIVPAALTLFAVICAVRKHWNWAFALLALATLSKLYPAILLVPFLLALQLRVQGRWYVWRRWLPIGIFVGICAIVIGVSLLLSVAETLVPLGYFIARPVESESLSASIIWIFSLLSKTPLTYVDSFGSHNISSPLSLPITLLMNMVLVVSLFSTWRLQRRGCIDLAMACLLTLLIVMVTAKIFSLQYLIWVIPLAAYVGQSSRSWLLFWTLIGLLTCWRLTVLLTSWIYPSITFLYTTPLLYAIRNFLLLGFILSILMSRSLLYHSLSHDKVSLKTPLRENREENSSSKEIRLKNSRDRRGIYFH